jgi:hypothetical protein
MNLPYQTAHQDLSPWLQWAVSTHSLVTEWIFPTRLNDSLIHCIFTHWLSITLFKGCGCHSRTFLPKVDWRHPTHMYWWKIIQILHGVPWLQKVQPLWVAHGKQYWGVLSALGGYLHGWAWYPWCGPNSHTHMCPWVSMVMCFGRMLPMRHLPVATCQRGKRPRQTSCPSEGATPEPFLTKVDGRHPTHEYWWKIMQILQGVLLSIDQIAR